MQKQLIPLYWVRNPRQLSTDAGMHRWVWDLHYPAPACDAPRLSDRRNSARHASFASGADGAARNLFVRLTVDGKTFNAPLTVKMDPRVKTSAGGPAEKIPGGDAPGVIMTESAQALLQGGSIRTQLEKLSAQAQRPTKDALEAFQKKLTALLGASGRILRSALRGKSRSAASTDKPARSTMQVWQADAEPTSSQMEALSATEHDSADVLKRWTEFKNTDLPALNRHAAGIQGSGSPAGGGPAPGRTAGRRRVGRGER